MTNKQKKIKNYTEEQLNEWMHEKDKCNHVYESEEEYLEAVASTFTVEELEELIALLE